MLCNFNEAVEALYIRVVVSTRGDLSRALTDEAKNWQARKYCLKDTGVCALRGDALLRRYSQYACHASAWTAYI